MSTGLTADQVDAQITRTLGRIDANFAKCSRLSSSLLTKIPMISSVVQSTHQSIIKRWMRYVHGTNDIHSATPSHGSELQQEDRHDAAISQVSRDCSTISPDELNPVSHECTHNPCALQTTRLLDTDLASSAYDATRGPTTTTPQKLENRLSTASAASDRTPTMSSPLKTGLSLLEAEAFVDEGMNLSISRVRGKSDSYCTLCTPGTPSSVHSSDFEPSTGKKSRFASTKSRKRERTHSDELDTPVLDMQLSRASLAYLADHSPIAKLDMTGAITEERGKNDDGIQADLKHNEGQPNIATPVSTKKASHTAEILQEPSLTIDDYGSDDEEPAPDFDLSLFPPIFHSGAAARQLVAVWSQFLATEDENARRKPTLSFDMLSDAVQSISRKKLGIILDTLVSANLLHSVQVGQQTYWNKR